MIKKLIINFILRVFILIFFFPLNKLVIYLHLVLYLSPIDLLMFIIIITIITKVIIIIVVIITITITIAINIIIITIIKKSIFNFIIIFIQFTSFLLTLLASNYFEWVKDLNHFC